jgi:protein-disulfide isomerase
MQLCYYTDETKERTRHMDKRFWAIIGIIVVIFGGIIIINKHSKNNSGNAAAATNHVIGNTASKVTLVEYGDYECPVCEGYYPTVQAVQQKYNDTVKFQFRNLPLSQVHPNAFAGARAAEAADKQGKFWEMHDALYSSTNWQEWSTANPNSANKYFENYAKQLGLNLTQFKKDFASSTVNNRINADIAAFNQTKQSMATPTFFINGKYVDNHKLVDSTGNPSVTSFSKLLDEALKNTK